ncbi:cytochrome o ubiquinol/quinol oxidase subunit IV [Alicyclobacillus pomorum]|jgi:cytochrome o ubiquinol oxidase operon protein cyoD|uniref:cytochrome o ubiquinol oxidase subunit IV n=1 Tax=Alicyclobacillus pomorum TaxID=204470 RepID=UPI00041618F2|nr:cytochrome C oxidase subunit IV family protein [Alicyclobacillus pomorum]
MASQHQTPTAHHEPSFPWQYVIGYVLSLVLTVIPLWLVLDHVLTPTPLTIGILFCAVLQIFVQLFMFMHFTHGDGSGEPAYQTVVLSIGFFFTVVFAGASIWIMSFSSQVQ